MSQLQIHHYLNHLRDLRKVSGSATETQLREAFKDLLKEWGRTLDLIFVPEYSFKTPANERRSVDGALLHKVRVPLGYWEAKDEKDDLDAEITYKFRRGYPQDNIIFEDTRQAVLIQHRVEVMRCAVDDVEQLETLLKRFFAYERPEITQYKLAVEQFKVDLPAVLAALRDMINTEHVRNAVFRDAARKFLVHAQGAINPSLTHDDVREMLIQHILTEDIFAKVFGEDDFHRQNNVAKQLYSLEEVFFTGEVKKRTLRALESYYAAIRAAAARISSHHDKQNFLKVIYESFYHVYNPKAADRLAVFYTPNEIVRFMIDGADWLCEQNFGKNLIDRNVEILDPATGTGTFVCELLEHFRGSSAAKLRHKYESELHANEVAILPYYVANLNIEATYSAIAEEYVEFPNLCFVDTLENVGRHTAQVGKTLDLFGAVSEENVARIKRQNGRRISVVIGNPPYRSNQMNENDENPNRPYPEIDRGIQLTYIARSNAQKPKAYDMYARFFRWASDRLSANGVLAFITNRSFVEKGVFDGFRKTIAAEFNAVYVVDLGGDVRGNPKLSGTKHNVFGIQTGVAISFLVRKENAKGCRILYSRRPEHETAEEKLSFLSSHHLKDIKHEEVHPDARGNWLEIADNDFETLLPLVSKSAKSAKRVLAGTALFKSYSLGVSTNRDEWLYDINEKALKQKVRFLVSAFDEKVAEFKDTKHRTGALVAVNYGTTIKWSETLKRRARSGGREAYDKSRIRRASYRPFFPLWLYQSQFFIDRPGASEEMFPPGMENIALCFSDVGSRSDWMVLAVDGVADLHFGASVDAYQQVPLRIMDAGGRWRYNITTWALEQFRERYPSRKRGSQVSEEAIFWYVYGVLHDPIYREEFAGNLRRGFPRIPLYDSFSQWRDWGQQLMALHTKYEDAVSFPLQRRNIDDEDPRPVLRADRDRGEIILDTATKLSGVPETAWDYKLGNRSAIESVLYQFREKTPRDATIRDQFNTYRFADHKERAVELLMKVTTVSVETVRIVNAMRAAKR